MTDWQLIETAPKGTGRLRDCFLAFSPDELSDEGGAIHICYWDPYRKRWWADADYALEPTHWLPLPPWPAGTK